MDCVYEPTGEPAPEGETHYRCERCRNDRTSKYPPHLLRRDCRPENIATRAVHFVQLQLHRVIRWLSSMYRWAVAGFPVRSDAEVAEILRDKCGPCRHFKGGVCVPCGCRVNRSRIAPVNKPRMKTEHCPLDPPLW